MAERASRATSVKSRDQLRPGSPVGRRWSPPAETDGKSSTRCGLPLTRTCPLQPGAIDKVATSTKIVTSPVSFGLDSDVAKRLGWDRKSRPPGQRDRPRGQCEEVHLRDERPQRSQKKRNMHYYDIISF